MCEGLVGSEGLEVQWSWGKQRAMFLWLGELAKAGGEVLTNQKNHFTGNNKAQATGRKCSLHRDSWWKRETAL